MNGASIAYLRAAADFQRDLIEEAAEELAGNPPDPQWLSAATRLQKAELELKAIELQLSAAAVPL